MASSSQSDRASGVSVVEALIERNRVLFSDSSDAMLILDDHRTIVEANPAAGALVGVSTDALIGRSLDTIMADGVEELHTAWRELFALGEAHREHRVVHAAGGTRLVECTYRSRLGPDRYLCIARDVTAHRLLQERLAQSERIESVGRLAGGIAHDFNNLLTAILGYAELLLSNKGSDDPDRPDIEQIQKAGQRAASLTQQLLAFSRKQVLLPKDVDLNGIVRGLQTMLARLIREDIAIVCDVAAGTAVVRIDPHQIETVILNLVLNARDALPAGGRIRVEAARVPRTQVDVPHDAPSDAAEYVRLRVADSGTGMPPEVLAHLFEPFFTTKEFGKGTGLGLASVYGIVRQSNGFISVDSEIGKGTTFTMHFPAVAGEAQQETPAAGLPAESPRGATRETILLVEDEDAVRVIVSAMLRRHGYEVLEASTPKGAREIFERSRDRIDLLLTDVVMPEMSGPALAQRLVAERPELKVLFISGYTDMTMPDGAESSNMGFLGKPFQASVLAAKVKEILSRRRKTA